MGADSPKRLKGEEPCLGDFLLGFAAGFEHLSLALIGFHLRLIRLAEYQLEAYTSLGQVYPNTLGIWGPDESLLTTSSAAARESLDYYDSFASRATLLLVSFSLLSILSFFLDGSEVSLLGYTKPTKLFVRLCCILSPSESFLSRLQRHFWNIPLHNEKFLRICMSPNEVDNLVLMIKVRIEKHFESKGVHSSQISSALKSQISTAPSSLRSPFLSIPFSTLDQIVKDDFLTAKSDHLGVHIYLINLGPQSHPYAYSYGRDGDSSPSFTRCLGTVWTGKERYIWIDLAAGPLSYGPALSGDGLLPRGDFHPLAAVHGLPKSEKAVLADLASLIWSAYQVLLVPSLRIPVPLERTLVVQFIHVHGSEEKDSRGLNWDNIEATFMDGGLLLKDQTLRFRTYHVNYNECPVCSFAISRATNSYTSRFFFQNYTLIVSDYLDSKRLHQTLQESDDELKRAAGIIDQEEDFSRVIPVYVFDLDYNRHLMLDRYHQSVAFKDMVIAVRTRSSQTVSDYNCNGRHVITQTRELERPIVGSILQSMWGVSPTHLVWSSRHNSTIVDYTWSVGQTPFGPFSETSSLSFVQRDAARRNVLLTTLNYTITSAIDVLGSISAHGGDRHLLKQSQHVVFVERWNLLKYKLEKAVSALSHSDFEMASYFIRSSDHDLFAIHALIYRASQELEATFTCFKDPPFPWASVAMVSFGFLAFFYNSQPYQCFLNFSQ
ncbi:hypothetical protein Sjap_023839 [Stephania japonica]|uniref:DUF7906 domain-containing protein n=1 Tax=Stephania japonica TaxID=461633 RepID=A0AAP0EH38_9MAGN